MTRRIAAPSLILLISGSATAQNSLFFDVSNAISPAKPSAIVEVWASFEPGGYAFAAAWFDAAASDDPFGEFSDPYSVLHTLGTFNGEIQPGGDLITHIIPGQVQFPVGEFVSDTSNPILIWRATWSTTDFSPRTINLHTITKRFSLYLDYDGNNEDFYGPGFEEAVGTIKVVPAPAAWAALLVMGVGVRRRRS